MKSAFRSLLNDQQVEAVETIDRPLLIIAGAGSGKTRVITYRIAHLLARGVPQSEILAVTFTNKAAREMAQRIRSLVPKKLARLTVSTFHAFGVQLLREHGSLLGYRDKFSIYDSQDQASLLKETARDLGLKTETLDLAAAAQAISAVKTARTGWTSETKHLKPLFKEYQRNLKLYNAVDFDDLIMLPIEILSKFPEAQKTCHERYRHILVDEFQDTSSAQYDLLRLLAGSGAVVCVVGDDDQSIYSWRGASYENILRFEKDFAGFQQVTLEQNYRCTKVILRAANALISKNTSRKPKRLWTGLPEGELIECFAAENEAEEAAHIVSRIRTLRIRDSLKFRDFAILLRANHLTRAIEEALVEERIPYQVSGGMSFFERQEVRDMVSYLKLAANPDDDTSLLRIVNTPRRGIGKKALEKATEIAASRHCSLFSALSALASGPADGAAGVEEKMRTAVAEFTGMVAEYRQKFLSGKKMADTLRELVEEIDYWGHLLAENRDARNKDVVKWKFANVESLVGSIADYEGDPDQASPNLFDYLTRVALASRDEPEEKGTEAAQEGRVNLMTIHAAKGLEFPVVFVAAVEQDVIPHVRSVEEEEPAEGAPVEEERRLFYVALTRAERRLHLSWCASRRRMGKPVEAFPSPFIDELPPECLSMEQPQAEMSPEDAARMFAEARKKLFSDG
jgi:DNA helicase-2/ATP-dependent DNA helicase PcrA